MTPPPDLSALSSSEKDALIAALLARIDELVARVEALEAENAALREKLNLPPKTPDNSSKPPSQGMKANGESKAKPKGKAHAGAPVRLRHQPPHPAHQQRLRTGTASLRRFPQGNQLLPLRMGCRNSMPTSDLSSKPPDDEASASSGPSVSPSTARRC